MDNNEGLYIASRCTWENEVHLSELISGKIANSKNASQFYEVLSILFCYIRENYFFVCADWLRAGRQIYIMGTLRSFSVINE